MLIDRENLYSSRSFVASYFKSRQSHYLRSSSPTFFEAPSQYSTVSPTFFEARNYLVPVRPIHTFFLLEGSKLSQYHHHHHHHHHHRNNYGQLGQVPPACWCLVGSFVSHFDSLNHITTATHGRASIRWPSTDVPTGTGMLLASMAKYLVLIDVPTGTPVCCYGSAGGW